MLPMIDENNLLKEKTYGITVILAHKLKIRNDLVPLP